MKRNFHYGETKAQRQSQWMTEFNDAVVALDAKHSGRIDWNSANHFFYTGLSAKEAAEKYINNRNS